MGMAGKSVPIFTFLHIKFFYSTFLQTLKSNVDERAPNNENVCKCVIELNFATINSLGDSSCSNRCTLLYITVLKVLVRSNEQKDIWQTRHAELNPFTLLAVW